MPTLRHALWRLEFEGRMFVSLAIAAVVMGASLLAFPAEPSALVLGGAALGLSSGAALRGGYVVLAAGFGLCSLVRMWAGSLLTPGRVMSFEVRADLFNAEGPYRLVRHPIYSSDLLALTLLSLCLPWPGLVMPALFYAHYASITRYEEAALARQQGPAYRAFTTEVPRLLPDSRAWRRWPQARQEWRLTREGVRYNALWLLLVPGMLVAAVTLRVTDALLIGLPALVDWVVLHIVLERRKGGGPSNGDLHPGPVTGGSP